MLQSHAEDAQGRKTHLESSGGGSAVISSKLEHLVEVPERIVGVLTHEEIALKGTSSREGPDL